MYKSKNEFDNELNEIITDDSSIEAWRKIRESLTQNLKHLKKVYTISQLKLRYFFLKDKDIQELCTAIFHKSPNKSKLPRSKSIKARSSSSTSKNTTSKKKRKRHTLYE